MERKTIVGLIAVVAIVAVVVVMIFAGFTGYIEISPYSVEYSLGLYYARPVLTVNVSGPANDMAIILTNPEGYTAIRSISKMDLIDNFESVKVLMREGRGSLPAGTYRLVVKTITPEKVVYEREVKFKPAIVRITDAEVKLEETFFGVYWHLRYSITVKNDGELPAYIDKVLIIIDGEECIDEHPREDYILGEGEIEGSTTSTRVKQRYPTDVKIELYSEGEKLLASSVASILYR